uniref:Pre-mRNA splicing Prp18-interacting factor n=1 Tax=Tanacetum cinerariifolium TaxID=118510 RepID=A0A6L2N7J5_TANCI|nr:hypothetical protein [Tanacetum cinerariifolium]
MASFDYRLNPLYLIKECSSCGALYTTNYCCSERSLRDRIICDLNKTPDLSQRPSQNCPKCENPVDGHYCQGCALLRKKFKEDLFTYCIKNGILQDFQDSSEPSNDNTNVVNALQDPFVVKQDPDENSSQSPPQINHHCCYGCGDPLDDIFCHQCTCELCGKGAYYGYSCPSKASIIPNPEPCNNQTIDELPQTLPSFDQHSTLKMGIHSLMIPDLILLMILLTFSTHLYNLLCILVNFAGTMLEEEKQIEDEEAAKARYWKIFVCYDDDNDEDYGFIKSSVENLVPNPSEFKGEHECDVPACENFTTFSNILFDSDYDFSSSDDRSFYDEDIPKEIYSNPLFDEEIFSIKIDPHHFNAESNLIESLLKHDSLIISSSSNIDPLFDEFAETRLIKRLLYDNSSPHPPKEFIFDNSDVGIESFCPSPIFVEDIDSFMEEIDLSFTLDDPMPSGIEDDDYDSERDILIHEELLSNDSLSLLENESFHFDIPSSSHPPAKPLDGNSRILNKMMGGISKHEVPMPKLMFTQPTLVLNQKKSPKLLPHQGHEAF